ncbi:MAG: hypothetical protein Q9226_008062 [Calogaya cf. arnoldii]
MPTSSGDSFKARRRFTRRAHKRDRSVSPEAEGATKQGTSMPPKRSRMIPVLESQSAIDGDYVQASAFGSPTGQSAASQYMPARSIEDSGSEYHEEGIERASLTIATAAVRSDSGPASAAEVRSGSSGKDRAGNVNEDQVQLPMQDMSTMATDDLFIQERKAHSRRMEEWREKRALKKAQDAADPSVPKQKMPRSQRNGRMIRMRALEKAQEAASQQMNSESPPLNDAQWEIDKEDLGVAAPRTEYDLMQGLVIYKPRNVEPKRRNSL